MQVLFKKKKPIICIKIKLQEYDLNGFNDLMNGLNKNNEDIETMELIIKERSNEINDCNEKVRPKLIFHFKYNL